MTFKVKNLIADKPGKYRSEVVANGNTYKVFGSLEDFNPMNPASKIVDKHTGYELSLSSLLAREIFVAVGSVSVDCLQFRQERGSAVSAAQVEEELVCQVHDREVRMSETLNLAEKAILAIEIQGIEKALTAIEKLTPRAGAST